MELENGETIRAGNIIWGAGVSATPLTKKLGVELDRAGRVKVNPDLSVPGHPEVFAVGDMALVLDGGRQAGAGRFTGGDADGARTWRESSRTSCRFPAAWRGRRSSIGTRARWRRSGARRRWRRWGSLNFPGFIAWLAWLGVHLIFLVGFRNKIAVLFQWFYSYVTYKRGARIITKGMRRNQPAMPASSKPKSA